jgi:hypothetical protein
VNRRGSSEAILTTSVVAVAQRPSWDADFTQDSRPDGKVDGMTELATLRRRHPTTAAGTHAPRQHLRTAPRSSPRTRRRRPASLALLAASVLALTAGGWALLVAPGEHAVMGSELRIPGGTLRLEGVEPEVLVHNPEMPAGMMPDPVPDGMRRVAVDVTLRADQAGGVVYAPERFTVSAGDAPPAVPVREQLGSGTMPEGSTLAATLTFLVPEDAPAAELYVEGASGHLALALEPGAAVHDGH